MIMELYSKVDKSIFELALACSNNVSRVRKGTVHLSACILGSSLTHAFVKKNSFVEIIQCTSQYCKEKSKTYMTATVTLTMT
jgi:hypothetical protein